MRIAQSDYKNIVSSAIVFALLWLLAVPTLKAQTLAEVVSSVLQKHPDIRSASHLLEAARARVKQSKSNYYPTVALNYQMSETDGEQGGLDVSSSSNRSDAILSWTLFNGFATKNSIKSTSKEKLAAEAELKATHDAVTLDITDAYLSILRLSYTAIRFDKYIAELTRMSENIEARVKGGRLSASQLAQATARLIQAENERSRIRSDLSGAKIRYQELTGEAPKNLRYPTLPTDIARQAISQLKSNADSHNANLRASNLKAAARDADISVAQAEFYPSLTLELSKRLHSDNEDATALDEDLGTSLQLTYELPLGNGAFGRKMEAEQRKLSADEDAKSVRMQIYTSLGELQKQLLEGLSIAAKLRENIAATDQVFNAYTAQFNAGKRSLLDLLGALGDKHRAHTAVIDNWYQNTLVTVQLHSLTGDLQSLIASSVNHKK